MDSLIIDRRQMLAGMAAGLTLPSRSGTARAAYDPPPAPRLPGTYVPPPGTHPFVFATPAQLKVFLDRRGGTFERARAVLEQRARAALEDPSRYTTPYSGCILNRYLYALTYEYGGAARVAADLATYAYLESLGSGYGDPSLATRARNTAKQILLRWSTEGFREGAILRSKLNQYCDDQGKNTQAVEFEIGLQIGRGMPHWIHSEDLLTGLRAFNSEEIRTLKSFTTDIARLIRYSANKRATLARPACNVFINYVSVSLNALLAISRYRNDSEALVETAFGGKKQIVIPWTTQVENNIYGPGTKVQRCYEGASKSKYFQTAQIEVGEIVDRYRAGEHQSLGYPLYSLRHLIMGAEIITQSGFQVYSSADNHGNPIQSALRYYGGYFAKLLSAETTRIPGGMQYPNSAQYAGKIISTSKGKTIEGADDLLVPFLLGYSVFPEDKILQDVITRAKSFAPNYNVCSSVSSIHYSRLINL